MTLTPPGGLINISDQGLRNETDRGFTRIYQAHNQLQGTAILSPVQGAGFKVLGGVTIVTGSKIGLASGLTNVVTVTVSISNGAVATNFWPTASINSLDHSKIDLYCWKPTAAGNNTPIAATTAITLHWWVTGS